MANTTSNTFSLTSVLLDTAKRLTGSGNNQNVNGKLNGIDFSNDTVLVSAMNEVDYAKGAETLQNQQVTTAEMVLAHINQTYGSQLSQYEQFLMLQQIAQSASESLATTQASVLDQLVNANQEVATLTQNQTNINSRLSDLNSEKTALEGQKASTIQSCDKKINSANSELASLNSQKTAAEKTISNAPGQIASLEKSITDLENQTDENGNKVDNSAKITELKRQKLALENQLSDAKNSLPGINRAITTQEGILAQAKEEKNNAIKNFDAQIAAKATEISTKEQELEIVTEQLAKAVLNQTGLTLEAAKISEMMVEAQTFEKSVMQMLAASSEQLAKTQNEKENAEEKLEVEEASLETAQTETKTTEASLKQTEQNLFAKYQKEILSGNNGFFA